MTVQRSRLLANAFALAKGDRHQGGRGRQQGGRRTFDSGGAPTWKATTVRLRTVEVARMGAVGRHV